MALNHSPVSHCFRFRMIVLIQFKSGKWFVRLSKFSIQIIFLYKYVGKTSAVHSVRGGGGGGGGGGGACCVIGRI